MEVILTREQFNNFISSQTKKYQKIYGFKIEPEKGIHDTHNNESDAFKHTFMQAYFYASIFIINIWKFNQ